MESLDEESILKLVELALTSTGLACEFGYKVGNKKYYVTC